MARLGWRHVFLAGLLAGRSPGARRSESLRGDTQDRRAVREKAGSGAELESQETFIGTKASAVVLVILVFQLPTIALFYYAEPKMKDGGAC